MSTCVYLGLWLPRGNGMCAKEECVCVREREGLRVHNSKKRYICFTYSAFVVVAVRNFFQDVIKKQSWGFAADKILHTKSNRTVLCINGISKEIVINWLFVAALDYPPLSISYQSTIYICQDFCVEEKYIRRWKVRKSWLNWQMRWFWKRCN